MSRQCPAKVHRKLKIHTMACLAPSCWAQLYRFKMAPDYPGIQGLSTLYCSCNMCSNGVQFLSMKIVFFLTFRLAASSEGKDFLFPLTKPQGETLGRKRFVICVFAFGCVWWMQLSILLTTRWEIGRVVSTPHHKRKIQSRDRWEPSCQLNWSCSKYQINLR